MQVRYVYHEDYQFCYSFRGRPGHKPSILMLHGFSAHKDMWLSVVKVQSATSPSAGQGFCVHVMSQKEWKAEGTQSHSPSSVLKLTQYSKFMQIVLSDKTY